MLYSSKYFSNISEYDCLIENLVFFLKSKFKQYNFLIFLKNYLNSNSFITKASELFDRSLINDANCKFLIKILHNFNRDQISILNIYKIQHNLNYQCSLLFAKSITTIPFFYKKKIIGILIFANSNENQKFTIQEIDSFNALGAIFSLAISNIKICKKNLDLAIKDPLTGLINRREMERIIKNEIVRSFKFSTPLFVLLIDIDHFKFYNDNNGHLLGDIALKRISNSLKKSVRNIDSVARFGGEEFCIILPNSNRALALKIANKLNKSICSLSLRGSSNQPLGKLSISIGISGFPETPAKNLIDAADIALYMAKQTGRNCSIVFSERTLNNFYSTKN